MGPRAGACRRSGSLLVLGPPCGVSGSRRRKGEGQTCLLGGREAQATRAALDHQQGAPPTPTPTPNAKVQHVAALLSLPGVRIALQGESAEDGRERNWL